tara:strand:+ start:4564 stop:7653 length:3090 start_codon:yes stop_codon:yes gene_type:complete
LVDIGKPLIAYDSMSMGEADPSFWDGMSATYGYQYRPIIGAMYGTSFEEDDSFNVLDHLTSEDLDDRNQVTMLATARSIDHLNYLRTHTALMRENREVLSKSGWGSMITAGILDPVNLLSLPFKGVGITARALSGAKSGFFIGAGTELIRAPFEPDATLTESGINILGSTALVGTLGGITGAFSGRASQRFVNEQTEVQNSLDVNPTGSFDYKNNWFVNSPMFKLVTSPFKAVLQADLPTSTKKFMTQIGADGGLTQMLNKAGQGISSVFMRSVTYMGDYYAHSRKLTSHYHNFMNQANQPIGFGSSGLREFAERLARERILREAQPNRPKLSSHEEAFINEMDVFYTKYGVDMLNNGLLATKDSISRNITRLTNDVDEINAQLKIEKNTRAKVKLREMLGKQKARLKDQEDLLATGYDPKYKGVYYPRYFNIDAIANDMDGFKTILRDWYTANPLSPNATASDIERSVNKTVDKILNKQNLEDDFMGHGLSKHLRHRELDVPNHLLLDFIEINPLDTAMYYMMRTGSKIEFANTFKGKSMDEMVDAEELAMIRHGNTAKAISEAKQNLFHMYDRVVGTPIQRPDALNRRISRALTDWTAYAFLGRAGLSSLPELGMIIMQHASKQGPLGREQLGATLKALTDLKTIGLSAKEVQIAGEALDMILGVAQNRMYEDFLRSPFTKGLSKVNEQGKRIFYTANLLAPITQITKQMAGVLGQHSLIDRSLRLVAGTIDQEGVELLARYGITIRDAKKIKKLVDDGKVQTSDTGRLFLANTESWGNDQLVRKFRGALATMTRNTIINATPADKPKIIDGVVYARMNPALKALGFKVDKRSSSMGYEVTRIENGLMALPFQFWNYTLGATTKILGAGFDADRTGKVAGFASMIALGYLTLYAKNPRSFNNMDYEDQLTRAIDQTGITGIYSDLFYMGLHARHRMGNLDRDDTVIQPKYRVNPPSELGAGLETVSDFAGASPSYLFDVADTAYLFGSGQSDEAIKKALRLTPVSSLYGMRTLMGEVEDVITPRGRF